MSIQYFSKEGLEQLKAELQQLKSIERPKISQQIAEARDKGDLSENAEYEAAKEAQGLLETRIQQLEMVLSQARVLDTSKVDTSKVMILSKVRIFNHSSGKEFNYQIVSEKEADYKLNKISVKSPIGSGLLGKKVGEKVEIKVPAGIIVCEVLDISI